MDAIKTGGVCADCGKAGDVFQLAPDVDPQCSACFACCAAHACVGECFKAMVRYVTESIGFCGEEECKQIAIYYRPDCEDGCGHRCEFE